MTLPPVAIACLGLGGGGSVAGIARLQTELLAPHLPVVAFSDRLPPQPWPHDFVRVSSRSFRWLRRFGHVPREWSSSVRLARALRERAAAGGLGAAVLHSHALAAAAAPRLRAFRVPVALIVHGDIRDRPPGTYDGRVTAFYRWATPRAYRSVDLLLVGSEAFARLVRSDPLVRARVVVLPSPVRVAELGPLGPPRQRAAGEPLHVGFVGRLAPEKGCRELARALVQLHGKGVAIRSTWAGSGPLRAELERLLAEGAPGGDHRFAGPVARGELGALFCSFDLVAMPSLSEPQGLVAIEAQLCGVPVVASRTGGLVDTVRPGRDGELAEPGDVAALTEALRRAAEGVETGRYRVPDREWLVRFDPAFYQGRFVDEIMRLIAKGVHR